MKKIAIIILCLAEITLFSTVYAQDTLNHKTVDKLFELNLNEFLNVVITPSKLRQSINNITQKVDLINAKEIETTVSGNRNLCEAIAKLPGVSVSVLSRNDANWGTYGGIGPKYSTYMLQGVPVDAFIDPMSLDLNAIDHIEVQRGPASVIYPNYLSQDFAGSQCPLAGTVNLILKEKVEQQKTSFQSSYGSYNTLNSQLFHQNRVDRLNYFFGSTYEMSDYTNYGIDGSWLNMKKKPEYQKTKIYGGLTLLLDKAEKQKLTFFGQETWHSGDAGRIYKGYDNKYGTVNVGYDIEFNDQFSMQSHFGVRSYDRSLQESNFGIIDTLKSNNNVNQLIVPIDISFSWHHGKSSMLCFGVDYQSAKYSTWTDPLVGYHIFGNKSSAIQNGAYFQEEWRPISKLTLRGGLRYAYIKNIIDLVNGGNAVDNNLSWGRLLWSAGVRYSINDHIALYANGGSSFSAPGLKSIGGTISLSDRGVVGRNGQLPNPDLKPENGIGLDGGIDFNLPVNFKLGIRGFYTILQDGIVDNVVNQNPSQSQSINTESTSKGVEIELTQRINSIISWYVNGTYMTSNIKNKLNADLNSVEIPFSPNHIVNIGASVSTLLGLTVTPSLNYNGGFYDGISKSSRIWYSPGTVINIYIAQRLAKNDLFVLDCFAQLYNITNNNYDLPWQFKNPGSSGMFGLKVTF
ncbi:MAG: TonB-dependent receptor [Bacteroidetes bacterium]|nr:TonB-dependent receptor [Bacteroidota bacterium]